MRLDPALQVHRSAQPVPADAALDAALISGSDARLALDPASRMNAYGTQPCPRPDEISLPSSNSVRSLSLLEAY